MAAFNADSLFEVAVACRCVQVQDVDNPVSASVMIDVVGEGVM